MSEQLNAPHILKHLAGQTREAKAAHRPLPLSSVTTMYMLAHEVLGMSPFAAMCFADTAHQQVGVRLAQDIALQAQASVVELSHSEGQNGSPTILKMIQAMEVGGADTDFAEEAIQQGIAFGNDLFDGKEITTGSLERNAQIVNILAARLKQEHAHAFDVMGLVYIDEVRARNILMILS